MNYDDDGLGMDLFGMDPMYGGDVDFFNDGANSPLHDAMPENGGMDDIFADSSLTIPMRDTYVNDPPPLSPALPQYQTMQTYDAHMSLENQINAQGYNSFEQPVQLINGDYTQPVEEQPIHRVATPQQHYYANERPSTSSHQQQQQKPVVYQTPTTTNSRPPTTQCRSQPAPARQRAIQPKGSNNNKKRAAEPAQNGAASTSVQLSAQENQEITQIMAQMAALQQQQTALNVDNSQAIQELQTKMLSIFNKDGLLAQIGATAPAPQQTPRNSSHRPSRPQNHGHHQQQPQHYDQQPTSPYQPQYAVVSQPSTSQGHVYSEYHQAPQQHVVVHQTQPQPHHQPQKQHHPPQQQHPPRQPQQLYRVATVPASSVQQMQGSYQQQSQTVYVQQAPPQQVNQGPTVGQYIRQQQQVQQIRVVKLQGPVVPPQSVNQPLPQQHHHPQQQQPHHVQQAPILAPQAPIFRPPPRQTPAQVERQQEEKKAVRRKRIHDFMSGMDDQLEDAGTHRPFSDLGDVLKRLLPYHRYLERDMQPEHIDFLDANLLRANLNNNERVKFLKGRTHQLFLEESARDEIKEEQNLLLYLDMEYEKRKLEEEKSQVNDFNREEFVMRSPLIPALRGTTVSHPTPLPHPPKFVNHYEYTPFAEIPRPVSPCKSPYLMSPSSSNRSHSPLKSPTFQQPRMRVRSTNSTSSHEPSSASPDKERRRREERNGRIEIEPPKKTRNLVPEKKIPQKTMPVVEPIRVKAEVVSPRKAEIPTKKARESPKKTVQHHDAKPFLKEIKREPVEAAAETSTAAEVVVTKIKAPKAASKTVKIKVKEEVVEPESLVPNCSDASAPAVKLPAKKAFLNRVRNAIPPALRSPPAQMAKPSNGVESDGSCSPELGLDDFSSVPSTPVDPSAPSFSRALDSRNSLPSPLKKLVPLPAPQPKKSTSSKKSKKIPVVEFPVETKIRVKLGPPPTPMPAPKETRSKRNSAGAEVRNDFVTPRRQRHEEQANLADVDTPATARRGPITLKLKLGGTVMTVDGDQEARDRNANLLKAKEKEEKRLRKEKRRKKREEHERKREERLKIKEEPVAGTSSPRGDAVMIPTEGLKFKIKFAQPRSRTVTPAIPAEPENLPSTSRASATRAMNGVATNHVSLPSTSQNPPLLPPIKLRIRVGPQEPMIERVVAPVTAAAAPSTSRVNGGGVANGPLPSPAAGSAQGAPPPAVEFSDQSDSDGERMRSAADETLRTWGGIGLNVQPNPPPLLPFSSHP